ncbi:WD40 domain-containing protein [Rhizoctonia solani AG-1 IA]|uniref:WD40 domain-containing protein n=1 Tax=Thanatephorus cucumeris (strain AG1-IA) TaxID=983506 RepID=L8WE48_THACA|nr:WD40 domain-containing protein [Rhizoctonia solani AG-1 IA]
MRANKRGNRDCAGVDGAVSTPKEVGAKGRSAPKRLWPTHLNVAVGERDEKAIKHSILELRVFSVASCCASSFGDESAAEGDLGSRKNENRGFSSFSVSFESPTGSNLGWRKCGGDWQSRAEARRGEMMNVRVRATTALDQQFEIYSGGTEPTRGAIVGLGPYREPPHLPIEFALSAASLHPHPPPAPRAHITEQCALALTTERTLLPTHRFTGQSRPSTTTNTVSKLAHALPTATTSATVRIGHVQLRDLVHSTGPRGRVAYVTDKSIKEVDVRRGVQVRLASPMLRSCFASRNVLVLILPVLFISTLSLFTSTTAVDHPSPSLSNMYKLIFIALSSQLEPSPPSISSGQNAELQFTTIAPPPHPSLARRRNRSKGYAAVSDERYKARKGNNYEESSDEESDEEEVDESMEWSMDGSEATRTRRVEVRGAGYRDIASINNHVLVLGDEQIDGGIYGQGKREPDRTRIVVSNNDEFVRVFDVDTRESASSKEWGSMEIVGSVRLGTPANHVSVSPDGRTMLAVGDDTRLQIFNVNSRSSLVDFERVGSYTSGTEPNFTSAWSASGLQFAAASQDGTVTVWDVRSSSPLASWRIPQRSGYRPHTANAPTQPSTSPSSSPYLGPARPYDSRFAGAYMNTEQFLWDPSTPGPGHGIRSLRFSPAGGNREMLVFTDRAS